MEINSAPSLENVSETGAQCGMEEQNALQRVASLPLVHSTVETLQAYYGNLKDNYPNVTPLLEVAEGITNAAANIAIASSKPVVCKYGSTLNSYANVGLDKLEDTMPILQEPAYKVLKDTKEIATNLITDKVDQALCYTENIVEYYLPDDSKIDGFEFESSDSEDMESISENKSVTEQRLSGISMKVRRRSYLKAMKRWNAVSTRSKETLGKLNHSVNLIQYAQQSLNVTANSITTSVSSVQENVQKKVSDAKEGLTTVAGVITQQWEEKVMASAVILSQQLAETCSRCVAFFQASPAYETLLEKATKAKEISHNLYDGLLGRTRVAELSSTAIEGIQEKIKVIEEILSELTEKLADKLSDLVKLSTSECQKTTSSEAMEKVSERADDDHTTAPLYHDKEATVVAATADDAAAAFDGGN